MWRRDSSSSDGSGRRAGSDKGGFGLVDSVRNYKYVKSYDRYFEGYEMKTVPKRNGNGTKTVRVYVGTAYRQELPLNRVVLLRLAHVVLFLCAATLYGIALIMPIPSNMTWYVNTTSFIPVIIYVRILLALISYIFSKRDLTIHEYKDGALRLLRLSGYAWRLLIAPIVASCVMFVLVADSFELMELVRFGAIIASGALMFLIGLLEKRIKYIEIPPVDDEED